MPLTNEERRQPGADLVTFIDQKFRGRQWKVRTCLSPTDANASAQGIVIEVGDSGFICLGSMFEAFTLALILLQAFAMQPEVQFNDSHKEIVDESRTGGADAPTR